MKCLAVAGLVVLGGCGACAKPRTPATPTCFDVTARQNSATTRTEFSARHCQGGGVTWAALLRVIVDRRGDVTSVDEPSPSMTGDVALLDGRLRFSIDDEGDAARFCADDPVLVASVRSDFERLNRDVEELRRAMAEAEPLALECLAADGG